MERIIKSFSQKALSRMTACCSSNSCVVRVCVRVRVGARGDV